MKKLVSLALIGATLVALAAPQELARVTVADGNELVKQASMFGGFANVPMIGIGAAGALGANPLALQFGAMRPGEVISAVVVGDPEAVGSKFDDLKKFGDSCKFAVLYPASVKKAEFLSSHAKLSEQDGAIKDGDVFYAFAADEKWVALADTAEGAKKILAEAGKAKMKGGEAARATLTEAGMNVLGKVMDMALQEAGKEGSDLPVEIKGDMLEAMKNALELLAQVKSVSMAARVSDKGVDFIYDVVAKPGTEIAKVGEKKLGANPLAFAGKEALVASAVAANCGASHQQAKYDELIGLLKQKGLKFDFVSVEKKGVVTKLMLDVKAAASYLKAEGLALGAKLDGDEEFKKSLMACKGKTRKFKAEGPAASMSFGIKGVTVAKTASERFALAFPEFKGKAQTLSQASVLSFYDTLVKGAKIVLAQIPEIPAEQKKQADEILASLPAASEGCVAGAVKKENGTLSMIMRVTPAEVKGLSTLVMTGFQLFQSAGCDSTLIEEDDDASGDDED